MHLFNVPCHSKAAQYGTLSRNSSIDRSAVGPDREPVGTTGCQGWYYRKKASMQGRTRDASSPPFPTLSGLLARKCFSAIKLQFQQLDQFPNSNLQAEARTYCSPPVLPSVLYMHKVPPISMLQTVGPFVIRTRITTMYTLTGHGFFFQDHFLQIKSLRASQGIVFSGAWPTCHWSVGAAHSPVTGPTLPSLTFWLPYTFEHDVTDCHPTPATMFSMSFQMYRPTSSNPLGTFRIPAESAIHRRVGR
jgi:hypothetical protein